MRACLRFAPALLIAVLAACGGQRPVPAPAPVESAAARAGAEHALVSSDVRIRVYRSGTLSRLGHNHVIVSSATTGTLWLAEPRAASSFDLVLPVASLRVDEPAERARAGDDFAAPVPADDAAATRTNLLGERVLDAARHRGIRLRSAELQPAAGGQWKVLVDITVREQSARVTVPVRLVDNGRRITVAGSFTVDHAALGLVPFSVAFGALSVREDIGIDFDLAFEPRPAT